MFSVSQAVPSRSVHRLLPLHTRPADEHASSIVPFSTGSQAPDAPHRSHVGQTRALQQTSSTQLLLSHSIEPRQAAPRGANDTVGAPAAPDPPGVGAGMPAAPAAPDVTAGSVPPLPAAVPLLPAAFSPLPATGSPLAAALPPVARTPSVRSGGRGISPSAPVVLASWVRASSGTHTFSAQYRLRGQSSSVRQRYLEAGETEVQLLPARIHSAMHVVDARRPNRTPASCTSPPEQTSAKPARANGGPRSADRTA